MPTYNYRCAACGHSFDQFQKFSEDTLTDCPECSGLIRRVMQPVGIVFKGSGWYINDSRNSNKAAKSSAESTSSSDANGSGKTDSKPEKTTTDKAPSDSKKTPVAATAEN